MKLYKNKIVVLGAVFNKIGEILVSQRFDPEVPDAHLKWDFIGGTNEKGESLEETLHRELLEEAGVTVHIDWLIPLNPQKTWKHNNYNLRITVYCFKCNLITQKKVKKDVKINKLEWKNIEDLKDLDLLSTCKLLLPYLAKSPDQPTW